MSEKVVKLFKLQEEKYDQILIKILKIYKYRQMYRETISMLQDHYRDAFDDEIKLNVKVAIENLRINLEIFNEMEDSLKKEGTKLEDSLHRTSNSSNKLENK